MLQARTDLLGAPHRICLYALDRRSEQNPNESWERQYLAKKESIDSQSKIMAAGRDTVTAGFPVANWFYGQSSGSAVIKRLTNTFNKASVANSDNLL